ncbi:hypothetical protein CEUSTIGMA_g9777.t1 [Chlamydomonas eustigma]|uniref:Phosphatidylinositol-glycan biosynthesis class X protein n=1 Tax=Chlamydomonas eustigma TaxID=1157962 RepID=A0A250XGZ6_9CHLO|nr:hypothetical protein CEUSTIGMA_g9777.t1 [Chlamydomonas eustigma]|eukprot:GAX82348.1 hypothetical protein CEUSTIGMA_g9777.t1 [Chlamydomonas eustigma]
MYVSLFHFCVTLLAAFAAPQCCAKWLQLMEIGMTLDGSGAHRELIYSLGALDTVMEASGCKAINKLVLVQKLPRELFVDPYQLENKFKHEGAGHTFQIHGPLDLEQPAPACLPITLTLSLNASIITASLSEIQTLGPSSMVLRIPVHARYPEPAQGLISAKAYADGSWLHWFLSGYEDVIIPEPFILLSSCKIESVSEERTKPHLEEADLDLNDGLHSVRVSEALRSDVPSACRDLEQDCVLSKQQASQTTNSLAAACQLLSLCISQGFDVLVQTRLKPSYQATQTMGDGKGRVCDDDGDDCVRGLLWVLPSGNVEHEAFVAWVTLASALFTCCAVGLSVIRVSVSQTRSIVK